MDESGRHGRALNRTTVTWQVPGDPPRFDNRFHAAVGRAFDRVQADFHIGSSGGKPLICVSG